MLKRFAVYTKPYRPQLVLASVLVVVECIFELVIPVLMADIIDVGVANGDKSYILRQSGLMILFALIALALGFWYARVASVASQGFGAELRRAEYAKIQRFSFSNLDHFRTSSLVTRLTGDVTVVQNALANGLRPIIRGPAMMITALIMAFLINPTLAIVFVVALPVLGLALFFIAQRLRPQYGKMQRALDGVNLVVQENLTAVRTVKSFVREDYECEKFGEVNADFQAVAQKAFHYAAFNAPIFQAVMYATIICILWFGGGLIQIGGMRIGELTGFLSYVMQILNSLMMISNVFLMLTRSVASGTRILEVMDEPIDIADRGDAALCVQHGEIEFDGVSFKYNPEAAEYVLRDINLHIRPGQTVGIIGGTGSAKSSLVQLIPRLYDITEGSLRIDGQEVSRYPLRHLRDAIGMVLQNNTLFSGTVRENLLWGNPTATRAEIDEVCRVACADEFIGRLPAGYDTDLGQGGSNVSGGQKQRLCIARALLKKPRVLIFDDSTSAVDTATEARIRQGLQQYLPSTTKIIIAQRITSVQDADQIVILDDGTINEIGTHETLLSHNPIYQEIYRAQQKGAAV